MTIEKIEERMDKLSKTINKKQSQVEYGDGVDFFQRLNSAAIEERREYSELSCRLRSMVTPNMEPLDNIGDHITLKEFISACKCGGFINYDGFGYYATETEQSDIEIYPSDITKNKNYRKDFTHVKWYNR